MQLVFRTFPRDTPFEPRRGEVYVRPDLLPESDRRAVALLVLRGGMSALPQGEGPLERVAISCDSTNPTLDDMLAATFALRLLEGRVLPQGCALFAEYAAAVRLGLRPGKVTPTESLAGLYLGVRNSAGADLTDAEVGGRFLDRWRALAGWIFQAAEEGLDPAVTALYERLPAFRQEFEYLAEDDRVYRQDVRRGQRWLVRLPGDPPHPGAGLLLRQPNSRLFKYWARADKDAPGGAGYLFMAVDFGKGNWVFTTDPVQHVPIGSLAAALQAAEAAKDRERAARDPWFDGKPFGHTLVAAPKGGTLLIEADILRVVRRWAGVPGPLTRRRLLVAGAAAAAAVLAPLPFLGLLHPRTDDSQASLARGLRMYADPESDSGAGGRGESRRTGPVAKGTDYALLIATNHYKEWGELVNPIPDGQAVGKDLKDLYGFQVELVTDPTREQLLDALRRYAQKKYADGDQLLIFLSGHGNFDPVTSMGFVVPGDARATDPNGSSFISHSELRDRVDALPCRHILLVLDCCFGGTFDSFIARGDRGGEYEGQSRGEFVAAKLEHVTRRYLTSGGKEYVPDGRPGQHSPFARKFLEALRSQPNKYGILTLAKLFETVETVKPAPRGGEFGKNEPGSDFLFVRRK